MSWFCNAADANGRTRTCSIRHPSLFRPSSSSTDERGRLLKKWGETLFALPHSVTVDRQDNIWVTDVAWHQVFKFSPDGTLVLTLGERGVAGDDGSHFNRPTDVAVAPDGSFYVSDGYGNNRVVKFGPDGKFLSQWGTKGTAPGQFDLPHGIALDAAGRVFVVDRRNARVQVFDRSGHYLSQLKGTPFVEPQDIAIGSDGAAFVTDIGEEQGDAGPIGSLCDADRRLFARSNRPPWQLRWPVHHCSRCCGRKGWGSLCGRFLWQASPEVLARERVTPENTGRHEVVAPPT